jgi:Mrp family chromosome partitioning ATPase
MVGESGAEIHVSPANVTEALRYMLGRLRLGDGPDLPERLGFTSAVSGEGASFLSRSLALILANDIARRVCIVDLNWWSPSVWPEEGERGGMADVARGMLGVEDAVIPTTNPGLSYVPAGATTAAERPLLAHRPELEKAFVELSDSFDHLILDLPAVSTTSEALVLAENAVGLMVVVQQGVTPDTEVKAALEQLEGFPVLGVMLNRSVSKIPRMLRRRLPGA